MKQSAYLIQQRETRRRLVRAAGRVTQPSSAYTHFVEYWKEGKA